MTPTQAVSVTFSHFESKKHSVRMKTDERLDGQFPLPDQYVPRRVLDLLGVHGAEQDSPALRVQLTYTIQDR